MVMISPSFAVLCLRRRLDAVTTNFAVLSLRLRCLDTVTVNKRLEAAFRRLLIRGWLGHDYRC